MQTISNDGDSALPALSENNIIHSNEQYSSQTLWNYCIKNGIIDPQQIQAEIEMAKNKELLAKHPYAIYQGKDGKWNVYLPDEKKGRIKITRKSKRDIEKTVIQYQREQEENPTLQECFKEANDRRLGLNMIAPSTHLRDTRMFNRHFGYIKSKRIKSITPEFLCDFLEEQIPKHNMTAKDFSRLKGVTKVLFKRAKARKLIDWNIEQVFMDLNTSDRMFKRVVKKDSEEVYSEEETELIVKYFHENLHNVHDQALLLAFITGTRVGELVALTPKDLIENKESQIYGVSICKTETRYEKDDKVFYDVVNHTKTQAGERVVIVPPGYAWFIRKLKYQNPFAEYLFMYRGKRIHEEGINDHLKRVCKKLNIPYRSSHKIRKTYASILATNCRDERFIIEQMGHVDIGITRDFYIKNRKSNERKSEMLGDISEFQSRMVQ